YFSVRTTGVYCRPSCAARLPRPENVSFHATLEEAERAGFRPCLRCNPREPSLRTQHAARITEACRLIEESDEVPTLATLADHAGLSPSHCRRVFRAVTGLTPRAYAAAHRAKRVRRELSRGGNVTDAIYDAGYGSNGRFYAESDAMLGMTPSRFRAGGTDTVIRFAVGQCSLGAILVAASDRGVCAIQLGDDADALARGLQQQFPQARRGWGGAGLETPL